jgi:hypothetical protein
VKGLLSDIYPGKDLFYTCVLSNLNEGIFKANSLEEWVSIWNCFTRTNYRTSYIIFLYLGFDIDFNAFAKRIRRNEIILVEEVNYKTIHVCFFSDNSAIIVKFF